jgi:LacI family fructose operon transcriptional repressor
MAARGYQVEADQIDQCGYEPSVAAVRIEALYRRFERLPTGLFINSCTAFEGVVQFFSTLPRSAIANTAIGCFDWDPVATFLPFPVLMIRQDAEQMIAKAFQLSDSFEERHPQTRLLVPTHLVEA